jgi:hypothetical protein
MTGTSLGVTATSAAVLGGWVVEVIGDRQLAVDRREGCGGTFVGARCRHAVCPTAAIERGRHKRVALRSQLRFEERDELVIEQEGPPRPARVGVSDRRAPASRQRQE